MLHRPSPRPLASLAPALAALCLLLIPALFVGTRPAAAQIPAAGAGAEAYTVSGIAVDVSAANANAARDQAIAQAQAKAWDELYRRITPGGAAAPKLSEVELARLVQGFSIDEEKASATRYIGSMTVRFRPNAVREVLAGSGSQYVEPPGRPYVLLPVSVDGGRAILWEDRTAWREAWEGRQQGASLVPLLVPDGELDDIAAIGVNEAQQGNADALARIAQKYNAGGVVVARTDLVNGAPDLGRGALSVDVTRYSLDGTREQRTISVRADPDDRPSDLLSRAVIQTAAAVDEAYRRDNTITAGPEQRLVATLPIGGLADWLEARKRLAAVNAITRLDVVSLSRYEVQIALTYRGDVPRLQQQLAKRDVSLSRLPAGPPQPGLAPGQPVVPPAETWQLTLAPVAAAPAPLTGPAPAPMSAPVPVAPPLSGGTLVPPAAVPSAMPSAAPAVNPTTRR